MGGNILFISVKKKANMSLHREHRVYACDISSIVEMHVTTIMLFLPKKGIDALMLVTRTLRKLIIDEQIKVKHSETFEFVLTLGVATIDGLISPISYLGDIRDLRSIGLVCAAMRPYCHNKRTLKHLMNRNLDRVLARFSLSRKYPVYDSLDQILRSTSAIIGGSILLQCATGEMYDENKTSDVDIYIQLGAEDCMEAYLYRNDYRRMNGMDQLNKDPEADYRSSAIDYVVTYIHAQSGMKVDMVIMKERASPQFAIGAYDFTFLMALYDGAIFELWFPMDIMERRGRYNTVRDSTTLM